MTLLIDALDKADKERLEKTADSKVKLGFADDDLPKEVNDDEQKVEQQPDVNSQPHSSTKTDSPIPASSPSSNAYRSRPSISPKKAGDFKYSIGLIVILFLLFIVTVIWWFGRSPSGLVVNLPNNSTTTSQSAQELQNDRTNERANNNALPEEQNIALLNNIGGQTEQDINKLNDKSQINSENNDSVDNKIQSEPLKFIEPEQNLSNPKNDFNSQIIEKNGSRRLNNNILSNKPKRAVVKKPAVKKPVKKASYPKKRSKKPSTKTNIKSSKASTDMNLAARYLKQNNYDGAVIIYKEVLRRNPGNIEAMQNMGVIAYNRGQYEDARVWLEKVLVRHPNHRFANNVLSAIDEFAGETLIDNAPDYNPAQTLYIQGNMYAEKSQWSAAQSLYANALSIDSSNPDYAYNLAVACDNLAKYDCALRNYQRALMNNRQFSGKFSSTIVRSRIYEILGTSPQ